MTCPRLVEVVLLLVSCLPFVTCYYECNRQSATCGCGLKNVETNAHILDGEDAVPYSWSMIVSVRFDCFGGGNASIHCCSGTILSDSHILTAAHCVDRISPGDLLAGDVTIAAGMHSRSQRCQTVRAVDEIVIAPGWTRLTNGSKHDIAILRLNESLDLARNLLVSRTCIPSPLNSVHGLASYPLANTSLAVVGWGTSRSHQNNTAHDVIQQAILLSTDQSHPTCAASVSEIETQFCAGVHHGCQGTCISDSGSPVFRWIGDRWEQVGIASQEMHSCESTNYQLVLTRVAAFHHWINDILQRQNLTTAMTTRISTTTTKTPQNIYQCKRNNATCGCGYADATLSTSRIVDGEEAVPYSWSMVVSLRYNCLNNGNFTVHCCGGTVLNNHYILTAAHCVDKIKGTSILSQNITIAAGIHNLAEFNQTIRQIDQIFIHPRYEGSTGWFENDIAILHLVQPLDVDADARITRTCRPPRMSSLEDIMEYPPSGSKLVVVGWGLLNKPFNVKPLALQQLSIYEIHHVYPSCAQFTSDIRVQFCAGVYNDTKGPCNGDSGGPVLQWFDDHWEQVGIASYVVRGCAAFGYPSVYTRLASFYDWIEWITNPSNYTTTTTTTTYRPPVVYDCSRQTKSCGCGKTNAAFESSRIIGGNEAVPYSWSMIVSIRANCFGDGNFKAHCCGGTILDEHHILTAAHCLEQVNPSSVLSYNITIAAGIHNLTEANATIRRVDKIFMHPKYAGQQHLYKNDIAIMHLDEPLDLDTNPFITRTCRPPPVDTLELLLDCPSNGTMLAVIGWGASNKPVTIRPRLLQQLKVYAVHENDSTCVRSIGHVEVQFCGGLYEGGTGICQGDSGGPIFEWLGDRWMQVGISSYTMNGCASPGYQSIFTRLASFHGWIEEVLNRKNSTASASTTASTTIKTSSIFSNQTNAPPLPVSFACNRSVPCGCGREDVSLTSSGIANRENAVDHSWSMVVSIRKGSSNAHLCSGSILSDSYILTAAHCVWDTRQQPHALTVAAGIINLNDPVVYMRTVSHVYVHPNYSDTNKDFRHDVALLRVDRPFALDNNSALAKTCMHDIDSTLGISQHPTNGTRLALIGWPKIRSNHSASSTNLQQSEVYVTDNRNPACSAVVHDSLLQFCAGPRQDEKDTCQDDSGAPTLRWTGQYWEQVGLVSYGSECSKSRAPVVHTRLACFYEWIENVLKADGEHLEPPKFWYVIADSSATTLPATTSASYYVQSERMLFVGAIALMFRQFAPF